MADSSIQQASTEDPPNVLKGNPSEGANRVRRCRSTPTDTTDQNPNVALCFNPRSYSRRHGVNCSLHQQSGGLSC
ncbi:unnamed protein product [Urochloa humidicola]